MGKDRKVYKLLVGKPLEGDHYEDRGKDGIKMDLNEIGWGLWGGFRWLRTGTCGGLL
jgi:hypothetical protein